MSSNRSLAKYLFPLSLLVAWSFDFLFYNKQVGISFPLFVAISLGVGFWLARQSKTTIPRNSLWLLLPIAFFALIGMLRVELFSLFLSRSLTLLLMTLLAANFIGGRWPNYSLSDYLAKFSLLPFNGLSSYRKMLDDEGDGKTKASTLKRFAPFGRGLLIASPILIVLALLLASADPIFEAWLENLLAFLNIENLAEYLWRSFYILILTYLLIGVYAYALKGSQNRKLLGEDKPLFSPFLGFTEAITVLASVELLFAIFVGIQLRYFFGGGSNINLAGYTYAEYARRGFGEMVAAALISVGLFVVLSLAIRREQEQEKQWFSRLGMGLFALVAVILVSAYQRLLLYESVFGFTRTRVNTHAFMIWLGLLLVALVILEARGQRRAFTLAAVLVTLGYAASINLLNVDAFIVRANAERLRRTEKVDVPYLASLSSDAVLPLIDQIKNSGVGGDSDYQSQLLAALACNAFVHNEYATAEHWQSFSLSQDAAQKAWTAFKASTAYERIDMPAELDGSEPIILVDQEEFYCGFYGFWD